MFRSDKARQLVSLLLLAFLLAACDDGGTTIRPSQPQIPPPPVVPPSSGDEGTPYTRLLALEKDIPGFGGYYVDGGWNMHVVLRDTSRLDDAREVLRPIHESFRRYFPPPGPPASPGSPPRMIAEQGRYAFSELYRWKQLAWQAGLGRGVVGSGISVKDNQITIRVTAAADVQQVFSMLTNGGIPRDAIQIRATGLGRPGMRGSGTDSGT